MNTFGFYLFLIICFVGFIVFAFMYVVQSEGNVYLKERIDKINLEILDCKVKLRISGNEELDKTIYWRNNDAYIIEECRMRKIRTIEELKELSLKGYY